MMKKVLAWLVCLLMLIPLWGCASVEEGTFPKGKTAEQNGVKAVLSEVEETTGSGTFAAKDGKVFLLCELTVENTTDSEMIVSSLMSFTCYVDEKETRVDFSALSNLGDEKKQLDGKVPAGQSMTGYLGYQVPKDWKKVKIEFQPDLLKTDKVTFVTAR